MFSFEYRWLFYIEFWTLLFSACLLFESLLVAIKFESLIAKSIPDFRDTRPLYLDLPRKNLMLVILGFYAVESRAFVT